MIELTQALLVAATGARESDASSFAMHLNAAARSFSINTQQRLAAFLAQIGHESGSLRYARELWGPTPAQLRYEGRRDLGNLVQGDGKRYLGRGLIQITGRANYCRARDKLRALLGPGAVPDFAELPQALEAPQWAAMSAAEYWASHRCNELADAGDFEAVTRAINGGLNGYAARQTRHLKALAALNASATVAPIDAGQPAESPPSRAPEPAPKTTQTTHRDTTMPLPALVLALLPSLIQQIPKLAGLFTGDNKVAERNVAAAQSVLEIVQDATGTANAQDAVETIQADPAARARATQAIEANWLALSEAGGDGIAGARKADAETAARGGRQLFASPSFIIGVLLLPLVYLIVLSLIGVVGNVEWSADVRAGMANAIIGVILGALAGYYFGQTTSRNRSPAPPEP